MARICKFSIFFLLSYIFMLIYNEVLDCKMKKANLFIVGMPKSGTTALYYFLKEHPDIFMSDWKEPHFFCKDIQESSDKYHKKKKYFNFRTLNEYNQLFEKAKGEKYIGESSTHYIFSKDAAKEIYKYNKDAKIIVFFREPVDFLHSWHGQMVQEMEERELDFGNALGLETKRRKSMKYNPNIRYPEELQYSKIVNYSKDLQRFYKVFDKKNIKIVIYEDFKEDNERTYLEIMDFLELSKKFKPKFKKHHVKKSVRFKFIFSIVKSKYIWKPLKKVLPRKVRRFLLNVFNKTMYKKRNDIKAVDSKLREELMKKYSKEVSELSKLLRVNLEKRWKYD